MWLTKEGFNALPASTGEEALKIARENTIEVAIVDFRISKEDGISVAQKLKELDADIKIIVLTGFPSYETAVQSMKIGAFDYLSKGDPSEKIISALNKAISQRQAERAFKEKNSPEDNRIKLILFCNHSLIKERLENYTKNSKELSLVKSYSSLEAIRGKEPARDAQIALICADCTLKSFSDAYMLLPQLFQVYPEIKSLLINENFSDQEKVELLRLGIRGFCSEDSGCEALEKAVSYLSKGELWISRKVTQMSLNAMLQNVSLSPLYGNSPDQSTEKNESTLNKRDHSNWNGLTSKEMEILKKISLGEKNREIAADFAISEATVKTHINRILKKLEVDNRTKAIKVALEKKII